MSLRMCVDTTMVCVLPNSRIRSKVNRRAAGSKPAVGSSHNNSGGSASSEAAIPKPGRLAGGEVLNLLVRGIQQADRAEQRYQPRPAQVAGDAADLAQQVEVLDGAEMPGQLRVCGQVPDQAADLDRVGAAGVAQHLRPPRAGPLQAQQQAEGGGLAGSVGAQQAEDGAPRDFEIHVVDRDESIAVDLGQMFGANRCFHGQLPSAGRD